MAARGDRFMRDNASKYGARDSKHSIISQVSPTQRYTYVSPTQRYTPVVAAPVPQYQLRAGYAMSPGGTIVDVHPSGSISTPPEAADTPRQSWSDRLSQYVETGTRGAAAAVRGARWVADQANTVTAAYHQALPSLTRAYGTGARIATVAAPVVAGAAEYVARRFARGPVRARHARGVRMGPVVIDPAWRG